MEGSDIIMNSLEIRKLINYIPIHGLISIRTSRRLMESFQYREQYSSIECASTW